MTTHAEHKRGYRAWPVCFGYFWSRDWPRYYIVAQSDHQLSGPAAASLKWCRFGVTKTRSLFLFPFNFLRHSFLTRIFRFKLSTNFKASFEVSGLRKLDLSGEALSGIDPNRSGTVRGGRGGTQQPPPQNNSQQKTGKISKTKNSNCTDCLGNQS